MKCTAFILSSFNYERSITNGSIKYYYQFQGQLHITKRKYGIMACWAKKEIKFKNIIIINNRYLLLM